jgi:2-keto-4-pentenoate hydratase/2-oxohepta-3-ene-1,7-dioic acid hydratase in catechol pathway
MSTSTFARVRLRSGETAFAEMSTNRALLLDKAPWHDGSQTGKEISSEEIELLCPVEPTKIVGIGRNYRAHVLEMGHELPKDPLMFLKPPSSLVGPNGAVILTRLSESIHFEGELGVVIGKRARHVSIADAPSFVFGYTILCDVTARDLQKKDGQWARAKGCDTFCPVGPHIVSGISGDALDIELLQNGERRQHGNSNDLIFSIPQLIAHISEAMTLEPGDLIATGTPAGVGQLHAGDRIEIRIEKIGELRFRVEADDRNLA